MQLIRLKGDHFDKVLRGATAVVRVSTKTPVLGDAVLTCDNVPPYRIPIVIQRITILPFEELNAFDIGKTKFKSNRTLQRGLETYYNIDIDPRQEVRLIEFFVDKEKESNG